MSAVSTIRSIRVRPVLAPMRRPLRTGSGAVERAPLLLIDLETSEGVVGRTYLFAISPAHLKPLVALVEAMAAMVAGAPLVPFELERTLRGRYALLGVHNVVLFAMAGIDMAAWDALARLRGVSLARLLGGAPRPIRAYNSNGLGLMPVAELAAEAEALVAEGFGAVKLRLGRPDAREDLAAVRAVRAAIGPDVALMCDYNQCLSVGDAILRGRMIDDEGGMAWIEEPTRADDFAGHARIARELRTPVQLGENFMGPEQMAQALAAGACDLVMPDAERIGGVTGWMRAAALAQAAGLEMSSHLFPEVSAHLLAVTPTAQWLEFVDWAAPVLADPPAPRDGAVVASDAPGSGIDWDEDAVARFAA
ncbi:MAG TPA: enolase C-terminal domain-like protein [Burkholderiaceae bacterium]|nr:enolase C-terminal domain-like protein [Burkholderiaceae bacterium]